MHAAFSLPWDQVFSFSCFFSLAGARPSILPDTAAHSSLLGVFISCLVSLVRRPPAAASAANEYLMECCHLSEFSKNDLCHSEGCRRSSPSCGCTCAHTSSLFLQGSDEGWMLDSLRLGEEPGSLRRQVCLAFPFSLVTATNAGSQAWAPVHTPRDKTAQGEK